MDKKLSKNQVALERKLTSLRNKIAQYKALVAFLKEYPAAARGTTIWYPANNPALCFMEKALLKTAYDKRKRRAILQLERWVDNDNWENRVLIEDAAKVSRKEFYKGLKKARINLNRPGSPS